MTTPVRPPPAGQSSEPTDLVTRFRTLVHSPLRAAILRFVHGRTEDAFEMEALMQALGRLRQDVENCVRELGDWGMLRRTEGPPVRYSARRPDDPTLVGLLDAFLERRVSATPEDQSASVQRFREMIGRDEKMLVIFEWIRTAAKSDISVLILGATGSGKEVVARMIHELSRRRVGRLQAVNCAALPETLFESELFGYEKGAFTGAADRKLGRLELADGGTLFLDEIGDLSIVSQAKLLRALESRRFERLGAERSIEVDFRLISATNRPLDLMVRETRFREDLYYRINAFSIRLPSLRERAVDIPVLAHKFLIRYCETNGLPADGKEFAPDAVQTLTTYHWPGNIRELESTVSRAALSAPHRVIHAADIEFLHAHSAPAAPGGTRLASLRDAERTHILRVLEAANWNKKEAAEILQISRGTLYRKIAEYALESAPPPAELNR